ncbi:MAG: radical SAM protein [Verrucomicrobiales bacterium]
MDEVKRLADSGVREVTLLGQIVNLYGRHEFPAQDGKSPFVQLLEAVHGVAGDPADPVYLATDRVQQDLVDAFRYLPKLASHVHFPLQSGSDRILKAMHRPYKAAKFVEICDRMKEARPGIAITTDIIVGFPGETEEDYEATKAVVRRVDFDNAFIFRYSKRRGTPAADMPDEIQLPESVKEARNQDLLALIGEISRPKYQAMVGGEFDVLCEDRARRTRNGCTAGPIRTRSFHQTATPASATPGRCSACASRTTTGLRSTGRRRCPDSAPGFLVEACPGFALRTLLPNFARCGDP